MVNAAVAQKKNIAVTLENLVSLGIPNSISGGHTENDEPQPQVVEAFGLRITNCAPSKPSL